MLTAQDIRQLSDADLTVELQKAKDLLFRQQLGVRTGHLKAAHLIRQLKGLIARFATVQTERRHSGKTVAESSKEVAGKLKAVGETLTKAEAQKPAKATRARAAATEAEGSDESVKVRSVK